MMKQRDSFTGSLACLVAGFLMLCLPASGFAFETGGMKGPKHTLPVTRADKTQKASPDSLKALLLGGVRFFQRQISPIDGPRCNFSPTCSQYGYQAVHDHGSALGVVMTADRLMRCSFWTEAGPDYARLPNGALSDPVANNLLK